MRKILVLTACAAMALSAPAFAQAIGSTSAAPPGSTGNTPGGPDSSQNGGMQPRQSGGAMKAQGSARHAQVAPMGQTAPNGNVSGKMKSGANGG